MICKFSYPLNSFSSTISTLNDENGKVVESSKAIVTKNFSKVDGLEIKVNDNANCTYKVFFYDEEKHFVSVSQTIDTDFNVSNVPETSKYFKLVIIPNQIDGEDVTVSIVNVPKYAGMLKVTYNK